MHNHFTVLVIDSKGSRVRETLISKRMLWAMALICVVATAIVATGTFRYLKLQHSVSEKNRLSAKIVEQQADIEQQRKQIQAFAQSINGLKSSLIALNEFENKLRIIANLEHKGDQASLFSAYRRP